MDFVIWGGPVFAPGGGAPAAGDIGRVQWARPTRVETFSHGPGGGIGSSSFAALAASVRTPSGSILDGLLASRGLSASSFDRIGIAGFSAFHGLADPMLAADGDRIAAACLLDSCFTLQGGNGKSGYAAYGARAIRGECAMIMTASNGQNGPGLPPSDTGYQCARASFDRALALAGGTEQSFDPPSALASAESATRAGAFYLLHFGAPFLHGDLINKLGLATLQTLFAPALVGDLPGEGASDGSLTETESLVALGFLGAAVAALAYAIGKRMR